MQGIERLSEFLQASSLPEVIVISDSADADHAELAIRSGAWIYMKNQHPRKLWPCR